MRHEGREGPADAAEERFARRFGEQEAGLPVGDRLGEAAGLVPDRQHDPKSMPVVFNLFSAAHPALSIEEDVRLRPFGSLCANIVPNW